MPRVPSVPRTPSVPSIPAMGTTISSPTAAMKFLFDEGLVYNAESGAGLFRCRNCRSIMTFVNRARCPMWQCSSWTCTCRNTLSYRTGSFFFGLKTPLNLVITFLHSWALGTPMMQSVHAAGINIRTGHLLARNLIYALEESLDESQMQVGKFFFFFFLRRL
jgi:hypothetical protein